MADEKIVWDAEFNPAVMTYWLLGGTIVLTVTVIGIPLLPIWLGVGMFVTRRYLDSHRCLLTERNLKVTKGIFVQTEKTVPLDRVTDLGLVQGPIMRALGIEALSVETAGQSSPGSLIQLTGIRDGRAFRDAVLEQRDLVVGSNEKRSPPQAAEDGGTAQLALLTEIRDTLQRIENAFNRSQ